MIRLLARLFIQNSGDISSPSVRRSYGVLCGAVGIGLNLVLFAGKFLAGWLSHSIAITADAFNNLSDAGSSIITMIGFRLSGQKPDTDHPFGHGRSEYISGLFVSVAILLMALELIRSSVEKIIHPQELDYSPLLLVILLASIAVKGYMGFYNRSIGEKIQSAAMKATALDSISDMVATSVVLTCTLISHFTQLQIDGYCGVLVGLFIGYAGIEAAKDTISLLLGPAPDPEFVARIKDIVLSYEKVLGIHDLMVHNYGPERTLISLHAEMPAEESFLELHETIDAIEHELFDRLRCHAVIHMDPVRIGDEETEHVKRLVNDHLKKLDERISLHDFQLVKCIGHTNVDFDIAVPYGFPMSEEDIKEEISGLLKKDNPEYVAVIEVDYE